MKTPDDYLYDKRDLRLLGFTDHDITRLGKPCVKVPWKYKNKQGVKHYWKKSRVDDFITNNSLGSVPADYWWNSY